MKKVPIVFAFDENLILPAEICICSLLENAKASTFYDIFILHGSKTDLRAFDAKRIKKAFPRCKITLKNIGNPFGNSYEIRDITNVTYYRLLIPFLIQEYDTIIYSDVDVIFRSDLSDIYSSINLDNYYFSGVRALAQHIPGYKKYYSDTIKIQPENIVYAGNIIINSKKIRQDGLVETFLEMAKKKYQFQDMDILNIACKGNILYMEPAFCVTTYFMDFAVNNKGLLTHYWEETAIDNALRNGIVHYNGQKPWKGYCVNFDIWWEYYRKSPFFDEKFYFDYFYNRLNEYDLLPLWKRVKILIRYFVYGRKEN